MARSQRTRKDLDYHPALQSLIKIGATYNCRAAVNLWISTWVQTLGASFTITNRQAASDDGDSLERRTQDYQRAAVRAVAEVLPTAKVLRHVDNETEYYALERKYQLTALRNPPQEVYLAVREEEPFHGH